MRMFCLLIAISLLLSSMAFSAQNAPRLRGRISDSSDAVISGSTIKVLKGTDVISEATTNATGDFDLELAAGDYQLEVNAHEFNSFRQDIRVAAGMAPISVSLKIATVAQKLDVNETAEKAVTIDSDLR